MHAKLFCKTGQLAGKSFHITDEASIGTSPENSIHLKPGILSGKHARIFFDKKKTSYFLEDLRSYNGTKLDGKDVHGKVKLNKRHIITFANTFNFIFQVLRDDEEFAEPKEKAVHGEGPVPARASKPRVSDDVVVMHEGRESAGAPPAARKKAEDEKIPATPIEAKKSLENQGAPPDAGSKTILDFGFVPLPSIPEAGPKSPEVPEDPNVAKQIGKRKSDAAPTMFIDVEKLEQELRRRAPPFLLEFRIAQGEKQSFGLKEGENVVGRLSTSDISIDDASMSRSHAVITVRSGTITIKDLGSKNGTFVDDQKLTSEVVIAPDAPIRFGLVKATIVRRTDKGV